MIVFKKIMYLMCRRIAYVMDFIMMLSFIESHLKRQYRKHFFNVSPNSFDAPFFPCPYLRRDIIIDGDIGVSLQKLGNIEIETGVIDKYHHIGLPSHNILLAERHIAEYRAKMQQNGYKTHVGKLPIVLYAGASNSRHQVATKETKRCLAVIFLQRSH